MEKKKFWCTPPDIYEKLNNEFDFDPCPFPKPDGFDGLTCEWGKLNYVNPPFGSIMHQGPNDKKPKKKGMTAWVRKAIQQNKHHGKGVFIIIPTQSYVNLLLEAGAELRSMGRIKWIDKNINEICKAPSPITGFYLPANTNNKLNNKKILDILNDIKAVMPFHDGDFTEAESQAMIKLNFLIEELNK